MSSDWEGRILIKYSCLHYRDGEDFQIIYEFSRALWSFPGPHIRSEYPDQTFL